MLNQKGKVATMKVAKTLKPVSLILLLSFPLLVQPASALSYSTRFNTCAQMKKQYRFGIALSLKIAGDYPAKISKLLYQRNEGLDFDYDGIVCETELLQNNLNPNSKSGTTTSIAPTPATTVSTVAPLPTSPQYVGFRNGGSATLRKGVTYQIYTCSDIAGPTAYMDVFSTTTGWTQKATGVDLLDATRCSSPGYAYRTSFGWSVTENPGAVTSVRLRGFVGGFLEMKVVITN
jgi:hypothetical protein